MIHLIKVVRLTSDGLASCIMGQPGLEQIYTPGQWHKARIGGFFAFETLEHAMSFSKILNNYDNTIQIWNAECKDGNVLSRPTFVPSTFSTTQFIESFWTEWLVSGKIIATCATTWPGTIIVKRLRLTSRIDMSEIGQKGSFK